MRPETIPSHLAYVSFQGSQLIGHKPYEYRLGQVRFSDVLSCQKIHPSTCSTGSGVLPLSTDTPPNSGPNRQVYSLPTSILLSHYFFTQSRKQRKVKGIHPSNNRRCGRRDPVIVSVCRDGHMVSEGSNAEEYRDRYRRR